MDVWGLSLPKIHSLLFLTGEKKSPLELKTFAVEISVCKEWCSVHNDRKQRLGSWGAGSGEEICIS